MTTHIILILVEIRMGFPKKLGKWIAEKAQKNKIKVLQDVIDKLNKALDCIAESERTHFKRIRGKI